MVISRELDYAIRILRCVADGETHSIGKMCDTEHIPRQVGHKILTKLQEAQMVSCTRGRGGGYTLSLDLKNITMFDVMNAIGSECGVNLCLMPQNACPRQKLSKDAGETHKLLSALQKELNDRVLSMNMYSVIYPVTEDTG